jgi:hypothetical protein
MIKLVRAFLEDGVATTGIGSFLSDRLADFPVEGNELVLYEATVGDAGAADAFRERGHESDVVGRWEWEYHQRTTSAITDEKLLVSK